ncbi:hypothetical protein MTO96_020053 [Rhipicephalus appendiculatus]
MAQRTSSSASASELTLDDYDPRPSDHLICDICHSVLRSPVECSCRHIFCSDCIKKWVNKGVNTCPTCRKSPATPFTPTLLAIRNMLNDLTARKGEGEVLGMGPTLKTEYYENDALPTARVLQGLCYCATEAE